MKTLVFLILLFIVVRGYTQEVWQPINFPDSLLATNINAEKEGIIFVATGNNNYYQGLFRSLDNGLSWEHLIVNPSINWVSVHSMKYHPNGDFYIGTSWGIYRSKDNGTTFQHIYSGGNMVSLNIAPDSSIYATTWGIVLRSVDYGETWDTILNPNGSNICFMDVAFGSNDEIYAVANAYSDLGEGFYRSLDYGNSWENTGITDLFLDYIEVNPTEMIITGGTEADLYQSENKGDTWVKRSYVGASHVVRDYNGTLYAYADYTPIWIGYRTSDNWGTTWSDPSDARINKYVKGISISDQHYIYLITNRNSMTDTCIYRSVSPILNNKLPESNLQLSVIPNPAADKIILNIILDKAEKYIIYDINGKSVLSGILNSAEIDVSNLNPGIYLLQSNYFGKFQSCKFIIQ